MGRTNETATQLIRFHQKELAHFYTALRKSDQEVFQDLFALAQYHIAPLAFSGAAELQMLIYFAMLLEQHKMIRSLQGAVQRLMEQQGVDPSRLDS